jgi:multidrug resistance efflux pump
VDNQIALIRQRVATWEQSKASLVLAQQEFDRAKRLLASKVVSNEEYDQKQAALAVATAQVSQALEKYDCSGNRWGYNPPQCEPRQ